MQPDVVGARDRHEIRAAIVEPLPVEVMDISAIRGVEPEDLAVHEDKSRGASPLSPSHRVTRAEPPDPGSEGFRVGQVDESMTHDGPISPTQRHMRSCIHKSPA
jgi:hypothetical protein